MFGIFKKRKKKYTYSDYIDCIQLYKEDIDASQNFIASLGKIPVDEERTIYAVKQARSNYSYSHIIVYPVTKDVYDALAEMKETGERNKQDLWQRVGKERLLDFYRPNTFPPSPPRSDKTEFSRDEAQRYAE